MAELPDLRAHGTDEPDRRGPVERLSRRALLEGAALGGTVLVLGGLVVSGLVAPLAGAPSRRQDDEILAFALGIQRLEAAFYREAVTAGALTGELAGFARTVAEQEAAHVSHLEALRTSREAPPAASYDLGRSIMEPEAFRATAQALEEAAVAGLNGQLPNLTPSARAGVAQVVSVDARHAAWIRAIAGEVAAPQAADAALGREGVRRRLEDAGLETAP